jgi:tRNA-specific 2-thiouridylase
MDVCFITRGHRAEFIGARASTAGGSICDTSGAVVGHHHGVEQFTVGQRRGLGVAFSERRYVVDVDATRAAVTIGSRADLLRDQTMLRDLAFAGAAPGPSPLLAQVRAHGEPVDARLVASTVCYERPQPRVAPGQAVVLYEGDTVVGGGIAI